MVAGPHSKVQAQPTYIGAASDCHSVRSVPPVLMSGPPPLHSALSIKNEFKNESKNRLVLHRQGTLTENPSTTPTSLRHHAHANTDPASAKLPSIVFAELGTQRHLPNFFPMIDAWKKKTNVNHLH